MNDNQDLLADILEGIIANVPGHIYVKDRDGHYLFCNEAQAKSLNLTVSEIIGKTDYDLSTKEKADSYRAIDLEVMALGKAYTIEEEAFYHNKNVTFLSTKAPLLNKQGEIIGVIGTSIDITSHKERDLLQLENQKQKVENERYKIITAEQEKFREKADRVVHDIRSPLASLLMLAACCTKLSEEDREILQASCGRLQDIANDLLRDYTPKKVHAHDFVQPTLVSTVLLEILSEKRSQYIKSPIKFNYDFDFDSSFAFININKSDFSRAVSNIINNAVDALADREDGVITINLIESTKDEVKVSIEDNGSGIHPDIVSKLLNNIPVTSGKDDGHGIGFSQVYDTLKESNGKLEINSQLGHGTAIILTFPRIKAPEWIAEKIHLNRDDIIIILDDDHSIHGAWDRKLKVVLKQAPGIQVEHFTSCWKAYNFIDNLSDKGKQKVLLLIDYEFVKEDTNGLTFIKNLGVNRSLLVTSHYGKEKIRKEAIEAKTKILPKTLAPHILTIFNESEHIIHHKKVDLVLVDDDKTFIQDFIGLNGIGKNIDRYYAPEDFLSHLIQYPKDTKIYLDNIFPEADVDGIDIAQNLHAQGYTNVFVITGKALNKKVPNYIKLIFKEEVEKLAKNLQ